MLKMYNASNESITMPLTMSLSTFERGRRVPISEVLSGGGVLSGEEKLEIKHFTVSGSVYYYNYAEMREFLDTLLAFLEDSPIRVYQDETDSRFIYARCNNIIDTWLDGRAELELTLEFVASDPYFYSDEHVDTQYFTESPLEFTIFVGGNVTTYPTFLLNHNSGAIGNIEIENITNSKKIILSDTIETDVIIDNKNLIVLATSDSILSVVNTDWLISGLDLQKGENVLKVTADGSFDYEIITKWRSKWL